MRCHFKNNLISTYGEHKAKILKLLKLENMAILNILTIFFAISDVFASFKLTVGHSFD